MDYKKLHRWNVSPSEAVRLQSELRGRIVLEPLRGRVRFVAGADLSFELYSDIVYAGFVVIDLKNFETVATSTAVATATMPYIPGLLTFREGPALLKAWRRLTVEPDVVVFDGQGIAHPRRMGVAAHMGLFLERPTIGCGKTKLCGTFGELGPRAGDSSSLIYKGETVGVALRTKDRTNPVFISPGHLIDVEDSVRVILASCHGYRIPEPTRRAHLLVNEVRRAAAA